MTQNQMLIEMPILRKKIKLSSFRSKENAEYYLLDTGAVLKLLYRLDALLYRVEKMDLKVALPKRIIEQVVEHLCKSYFKRKEKEMCTQPIEKGMKNLAIILDNEKIKKIEHPEEVDKKLYGRFAEDDFLAFLLLEENFRGVVTQDNKFRKKVPKDKIVLDCSDLFR